MSKFVVIILLLGVICNADAKDLKGSFAIKGVGTLTCQMFLDAAASDAVILQQYAGYVTGYVSAFNELSNETFDLLPWQQLDTYMLLLLQQCKEKPQVTVGSAVSQIARYFKAKKIKVAAQTIEIKGAGIKLHFYPEVVRQIKTELKRKGYDTSDIWQAMVQFKQDNSLKGKHPFEQLILMKLLYGK
jgi:hypothetical protein